MTTDKKFSVNPGYPGSKNNNIMKKIITLITMPAFGRACTMLCIGITLLTINLSAQTQSPPAPNNGNNPTQNGNTPVGGGAPLGSGLLVLMALGAAYGSKKVFELKTKERE
jgi:hypothetical protein